jgi:hypothetical protein
MSEAQAIIEHEIQNNSLSLNDLGKKDAKGSTGADLVNPAD